MGETPDEELQYVNHRYERSVQDKRRMHHWYLIDQHGAEHLAVVGIETDTLDGHYTYSALEPFASQQALNCGNQSGVFKYLERWLTGAGADEEPSASSAGASSAATGAGRRKAFTSGLCSSRQAILNAAGASPVHHSTGPGRGKGKAKQNAVTAYSTGPGGKQKAVGIVQQNQIKKARKIQEDIRAEHDKLVASHISRLRRAAAAELQADTAAKQVTMGWLQGGLTEEELEHLDHWRSVLATVLDLQERQHANGQPQQPQQHHRKHKAGAAAAGASAEGQAAAAAGAQGHVPEKLLAWLQSPESSRHYLRVMLECLRELGATDVPARVLMQHKLIALVQRCKCEHQHEAVRSLAETILSRWRWQLTGHMQVLSQPVYMEDHVGVLEEEVTAGLVPVPALPKFKQALLNTPLPTFTTGLGSRGTHTPSYSNHQQTHHHHHLQHMSSSTPKLTDAAAAEGFQGYPGYEGVSGLDAMTAAAAAYGGLHATNPGFYTPMPSLLGVQLAAASPVPGGAAAAAHTAGVSGHPLMLYGPGSLPGQGLQVQPGQQMLAMDAAAASGAAAAAAGGVLMGSQGNLLQGWQQIQQAVGAGGAAAGPAGSIGLTYGAAGATGDSQLGAMQAMQQQ